MKPISILLLLLVAGCKIQAQDIHYFDLEKENAELRHKLSDLEKIHSQCYGYQKNLDSTTHKVARKDAPHSGYLGVSSFEKESTEKPRKIYDSVSQGTITRLDGDITFSTGTPGLISSSSGTFSNPNGYMSSLQYQTLAAYPTESDYAQWYNNDCDHSICEEESRSWKDLYGLLYGSYELLFSINSEDWVKSLTRQGYSVTKTSKKSWRTSTSSMKSYVNGKLIKSTTSNPNTFFQSSGEEIQDLGEYLKKQYLAKK